MQATLTRPRLVVQAAGPFGWRTLTAWSAALTIALLVATAVMLGDREAAGLAAVALVGLALMRYRPGVLILSGIFAATLAFMLPGAILNLMHGQGLLAYLVPLSLSAASAAGLIGALGALLRPTGGVGTARWVAAAIWVTYAFALLGGAAAARDVQAVAATELTISAKTNAFSTTALQAEHGQVTLRFANKDLFWHTFTIDSLGVDLRVPVNAEEELSFEATPGTYEFYCAIPGHALIGMKGTLVVW